MGNVSANHICEPAPHSCGALLDEDVNVCRLIAIFLRGVPCLTCTANRPKFEETRNVKGFKKIAGFTPSPTMTMDEAFRNVRSRHSVRIISSASDSTLYTYWHHAAEQGHADMLSSIIQLKHDRKEPFDVDSLDEDGLTAMHKAARAGKSQICKLLAKVWRTRIAASL